MNEISVQELQSKLAKGEDFLLIDVREPLEFETGNIGGKPIPMGEILNRLDEIPTEKTVVIHCKSGGRSGNVVRYLSAEKGFQNLYNLTGGILAWKNEIDPTLDVL
jgi:adenylyltransferase/sulfurtransferase